MKKKPFIGQTKAGVWFVACFPDDGKRFQKSIGHGDKGERIAHEISDLLVQDALSLDEFYSWDAKDKDWESCIRLVKERQLQTEAEKNEFFGQTWATSTSEQVKPSQGHCSSSTPSIASISLAPSLKQAVESYIKDMSVRCVSREFIKNVLRVALKHFYPAFGEDTPIDQISYAKDIAPWINRMLNSKSDRKNGKKRCAATVSRYCSMLRSVFNYAIMEGWIIASPMRRWRKPKETPRRFQLTREDAVKIMQECSEHTRWAVEVCFNLGLRPGRSELLALRYDSVNFEKGTVTVYASKTKTYREIPVKKDFLEHLREKRKQSQEGYVIEYRGKQVKSIHHSFRRAVKRAGITYPVRLYDLRHMFATFMLAAGADLSAVSRLMGHHSVKMTADTYYQYMKGEKERAISLLPSLTSKENDPTENQRVG